MKARYLLSILLIGATINLTGCTPAEETEDDNVEQGGGDNGGGDNGGGDNGGGDNGGGDNGGGDNGGGDNGGGDNGGGGDDAGKTSKEVYREQVFSYSLNCINCHGVGGNIAPMIASVTTVANFPEEAYAAAQSVTNFGNIEMSAMLTVFQQPNGHSSFCAPQSACQQHYDALLPRLNRWKAKVDEEIANQPTFPDLNIANVANGQTQYQNSCLGAGCHNANGTGSGLGIAGATLTGIFSPSFATMPPGNAASCDEVCANDIAAYLCTVVYANRNDICLDIVDENENDAKGHFSLASAGTHHSGNLSYRLSSLYNIAIDEELSQHDPALLEKTEALAKRIVELEAVDACSYDNDMSCGRLFTCMETMPNI